MVIDSSDHLRQGLPQLERFQLTGILPRLDQRSLEQGIDWIDTAAAYGFVHSEDVVGRALDGLREDAELRWAA